jgi:uncharacterized protein (DUF1501 family)
MKDADKELMISRRMFLRQSACAALGCSGIVNALTQLSIVNSAIAQGSFSDYKALIVLFLAGGNDSSNMIIPRMGHPAYANYKSARGILTIYDPADGQKPSGAPTSIPLTSMDGNYGVHPNMSGVATLFNQGDLAFVANVGTLVYPLTHKQQIWNNTVPSPPQLFSHADQQVQWQSSVPDQAFRTGWGGRVADLLNTPGSDKVSMSISVAGINKLQVGLETAQFGMTGAGTVNLAGYGANYGSALNPDGTYKTTTVGKRLETFETIMRYTHSNLIEEGYNRVVRSGRDSEARVGAAFQAAASSGVNFDNLFGANPSGLIQQLKTIAKLIAGREHLGNQRQLFFASVSGYDTHQWEMPAHNNLMGELSFALKAFRDAMVGLGVNDKVLTISHSDFSRTLSPNGTTIDEAGTDHAWGGHQIVMGGAVNGGRIYGHFPDLSMGGDNDVYGRGQYIPTTSVDQFSAVAARWFGITPSNLPLVFPNLGRFDDPFGSTANLGYVSLA